MNNVIKTEKISKIFSSGNNISFRAIDEVSLDIPGGQITLLRGPSGSGKTTLLTILGCLAKPSSGASWILGENISRWSEDFLTAFRREHIGIVFQNFNLIAGLTVMENVMLPLIPTGLSDGKISRHVQDALEQSHISHRSQASIDTLSGGEKQRVAIARALVNHPDIILADEPTSHLDSRLSGEILSVFDELRKQGKTIVIATHDPIVEAHLPIAQTICLRDGRIERDDAC